MGCSSAWKEGNKARKKQGSSCDRVNERSRRAQYCIHMWPTFWQVGASLHFMHGQHLSHAESPPPRTLISHGARDWVQTSTSPDEISFWVQVILKLMGKKVLCEQKTWSLHLNQVVPQRQAAALSLCLLTLTLLQMNSRGCGNIESQNQTSETIMTESLWLHLQETVVCGICREQHNYKRRVNLKCHVRNEIFWRQNSVSWLIKLLARKRQDGVAAVKRVN